MWEVEGLKLTLVSHQQALAEDDELDLEEVLARQVYEYYREDEPPQHEYERLVHRCGLTVLQTKC